MVFFNSSILLLLMPLVIFLIGICGIFLTRKNLIIVLMSIELLLLSVNLNFIICSYILDDIYGHALVMFILTVAAAETAIGLAILIVYNRLHNVIDVETMNTLRY